MRKDDYDDEEEKIQMAQKLHSTSLTLLFCHTCERIYHDKTVGSDYHSGGKLKLTRDLEIRFFCTPINITQKQFWVGMGAGETRALFVP